MSTQQQEDNETLEQMKSNRYTPTGQKRHPSNTNPLPTEVNRLCQDRATNQPDKVFCINN